VRNFRVQGVVNEASSSAGDDDGLHQTSFVSMQIFVLLP
jgi:hypothetical protein